MNVEAPKPLISLVVPVYNEEDNVEPFYNAVTDVIRTLADRYEFELVLTDNHSEDQTFEKLTKLAEDDARVRVIRFSRNFGYQRSIYTAYLAARGAAAIQLDVDLQDPPSLIVEFLNKWEEGYKVVYGQRISRDESRLMETARKGFYRMINAVSEDPLPLDAGDFRLIDRCIIDELRRIDDQQPYLRGIISTLGHKQIGIPYDRAARQRGRSKFRFRNLLGLAVDGFVSQSLAPLRLATYLGLFICALTTLTIVGYLAAKVFFGSAWPPGFATLAILLLFSMGLNALFLGIIGEYVGRIYRQVRRRPLTIVEREIPAKAPKTRITEETCNDHHEWSIDDAA